MLQQVAECGISLFSNRKICFTFGRVFVFERKLFVRQVRKGKILRPVCLVKKNKLSFVDYIFFNA